MLKKLVFSAILILILLPVALYSYINHEVHKKIPLLEPELITINKGTTISSFSRELVKKGWIETNFWLKAYIKLTPELSALKQGSFLIPTGINYVDLITLLVKGKEHQFAITFIEGSTLKDWLIALANDKNLTQKTSDLSVNNVAEYLGVEHQNAEGLFFPDTYFFTSGTSTLEILRRANKRMTKELESLWNERDPDLPYENAYEALIMASIIEKESALQSEHPVISSVFINRLNKKMRLQTDPTVIYGLGDRYKGDIKRVHLREKTAYNTYRIHGLPPTPIAMPGKLALKAAMHPDTTDYLYFVSDGYGKHVFSKTLKEHNKAVAEYLLATKSK
ncbi:endolytic transglycosylase MltG [Colwellia sp. RE-S-Sl-9]